MSRLPHNRKKQCRDVLKLSDADTIRFLQLYRSEHLLYDMTMDEYRQRDLRAVAANRIARALNVVDFGPAEVLTKFKNLRNAYSQELKKIEDSDKSGASIDDIYVPKVHWFPTMNSFLRPFIYQRPTLVVPSRKNKEISETQSTYSSIQDDDNDEEDIKIKVEPDQEMPQQQQQQQQHTTATAVNSKPGPSSHTQASSDVCNKRKCDVIKHEDDSGGGGDKSTKRNKSSGSDDDAIIAKLQEISASVRSMSSKPPQDVYDHFGNYIASLLRSVGAPRALKIQQDISNLVLAEITQT